MRLMWGRRAEKKSNFFVTVIFVLAVIGAVMSSGGSELTITGNAVASTESSEINFGFLGLVLALGALIGLVILGFFALSSDRPKNVTAGPKKTCLPEFAKVDKEIDSLSRRLNEIDISLGNK